MPWGGIALGMLVLLLSGSSFSEIITPQVLAVASIVFKYIVYAISCRFLFSTWCTFPHWKLANALRTKTCCKYRTYLNKLAFSAESSLLEFWLLWWFCNGFKPPALFFILCSIIIIFCGRISLIQVTFFIARSIILPAIF